MAKDKKASKATAVAPKPALSKPLETVKAGRVTKKAMSTKNSKESAKKTGKEVEKQKKKKKKAKSPSPRSGSSSSSSSSSSSGSSSSSSSGSESDSEVEIKAASKMNGTSKPADNSNSDDSSSASGSEDEAPKENGKAAANKDSDDSSDTSDSDSDGGVDAKAGANKIDTEMKDDDSSDDSSDEDEAPKATNNGKVTAKKAESDSSGSDDSEDDSEEEEEVKPKVEESSKKRKAEGVVEKTPKKTKVMVDGEEKEASGNLFIGNLSWNVDEEWLTREFEEFGEISGVRIITDRESGRSKGYGYVEFTEVSSGINALEAKNGADVDGRAIRCDFSTPRPARNDSGGTPQQRSFDRAKQFGDSTNQPSTTLFVGNIPFGADESTVTEAFESFGTIKSVRLPTDRDTGDPKGFGYVEFYTLDEAKAAHDGMAGEMIAGRPIRLDYAGARSNDSPRGGFGDRGGRGGGRGRGGFGDRGGRGGGRGGFNARGGRGGRGSGSTNRGGFGDFSGRKTTF